LTASPDPLTLAGGLIVAYLVGSIPCGYVIVRIVRGVDIRDHGSGNLGATNVIRTAGLIPGLLAGLADLLKGLAGVSIFCAWLPTAPAWAKVAVGLVTIAGHNWPVWLRFRGGKGVLTTAGVFLYLAWLPLILAVASFGVVFGLTRYVSVGSCTAATTLAVAVFALDGPWREPYTETVAVMAAVLVFVRHRENIQRLLTGNESRFGRKRRKR